MKKDYMFELLNMGLPFIEVVADIISEKTKNNWYKDFVHNNIVHPSMSFMSVEHADLIHDTNATWAFGLHRFDELGLEKPNDN